MLETPSLKGMAMTTGNAKLMKSCSSSSSFNSKPLRRKRNNEHAAERVINIVDFEFSPKTLRVPTGFKVIWKKTSGEPTDEHVIRFIGMEEKEGDVPFGIGGSYSRIFPYPGKYQYYCERHVFMRGEIIVEGSGERLEKEVAQENTRQSPVFESGKRLDADAKYKEYASKRQSSREKLAKARANREVESKLGVTADFERLNVSIDVRQQNNGAELVRFGSFDGADESEEEGPSGNSSRYVSSTKDLSNLRFGSYGEIPADEIAAASTESHALVQLEGSPENAAVPLSIVEMDTSNASTEVSVHVDEAHDQISSRLPARSSMFDAKGAIEFLSERWRMCVNDASIKRL